MNSIERISGIDESKLSGEHYFETLLRQVMENKTIDSAQLERIGMQVLALLSETCREITRGKSSSIRIETAQTLMRSNLYAIGVYLKSLPVPAAIECLKCVPIDDLFQKGQNLIEQKVKVATILYKAVLQSKLSTSNHAYNDTLISGIQSFFDTYDTRFQAHEIPASIDYPLMKPVTDLTGVEYMVEYLQSLYFENLFCRRFNDEAMHQAMLGYDSGYSDLLINLSEQTLQNALGCALAGRDCLSLELDQSDIELLRLLFATQTRQQAQTQLKQAFEELCRAVSITDRSMKEYLALGLSGLAQRIAQALSVNALHTVFTPTRRVIPMAVFSMGKRMDDERYRNMVGEVRSCRYFQDKIGILRDQIASLADLEDVLLNCEFSAQECFIILEGLDTYEVAALLKKHPFDFDQSDQSEDENRMRRNLNAYMLKATDDRRSAINKTEDSVQVEE